MDRPPRYEEVSRSSKRTTNPAPVKTGSPNSGGSKSGEAKFVLLSIAFNDRIRLVRFPEELTVRVSDVLHTVWPKGIQDTKTLEQALEIKLRGNPFSHGSDEEKLAIRQAFLAVFDALAKDGWGVVPGTGGLGRIGNSDPHMEKDSIIFRQQVMQELSWICVSFDSRDLIHLLNAPPELAISMVKVFGDKIEKCNQDIMSGHFELKLREAPWAQPSTKGAIRVRLIILDVLSCLQEHGYDLSASLDLDNGQGGSEYQSSGKAWFCSRSVHHLES